MIVTIDGPAGSGKSTVAKLLAEKLNFYHLNSGQIFRAITAFCLSNRLIDSNDLSLGQFVDQWEIALTHQDEKAHWSINGFDVTPQLSSNLVVQHVSRISASPEVRKRARQWQQLWAAGKNAIVEGRDAGSAVFPEALIKIYLTADLATRAKRRFIQNRAQALVNALSLEEIEIDLKRRDDADQKRDHDPLICPKGAVTFDTSNISAATATNRLYGLIKASIELD